MSETETVKKREATTFRGDVLRLVSGTGIAQVIGILSIPILTRLYAPEAFGMMALFASIAGIIGVVSCLRYELAIVLPDNDREAANLLALSLGITVLIALFTLPVVAFGRETIAGWVSMPELAPYLWLLPPAVLLGGFFKALNYWNTRTKHFTRLSISRVSEATAGNGSKLTAGFAGYATGGTMIAATVVGQAVATTVLGGQILRDDGRFLWRNIRWTNIAAGIKRHKKFPIYSTWAGILNTASWQLPILMLGAFFSPAVVGYYALGFRIFQMPMQLIGRAIGQVFHQRAAEAQNEGNVAPLVEDTFRRLVVISLFPILLLMVIGPELYVVAFGRDWAESGYYAQLLAPLALFWFISSPISSLYFVLEQQLQALKWQFALFLTTLASLSIGVYCNSVTIILLLLMLSGIIVYGYLIVYLFNSTGAKILNVLIALRQHICLVLGLLFSVLVVKLYVSESWIIVAWGLLGWVVCYCRNETKLALRRFL